MGDLEALQRDGCHVWFARLDDAPGLDACRAWLSADERGRLERFVLEPPRRLYLLGHALVRGVLSHYTDISPSAWQFSATAEGKPELAAPAGCPPLRFNLSHSGGVAVCGVTLRREIGVDVEDTRRAVDALGLSRRYFAPGEAAEIARCAGPQRRQRFFAIWTIKEAVLKACGTGIAGGLAGFEVLLAGDGGVRIRMRADASARLRERFAPDGWTVHQQPLTQHHLFAAAVQGGPAGLAAPRIRAWRPPAGDHSSSI